MWGNSKYSQKLVIHIVLIYLVISISWLIFSHYLKLVFQGSEAIELIKGCLFVVLTAYIFHYLIRKGINDFLKSEAKYRIMVENVTDLISIIDTKGNIEYVSPSHEKIFGYTQDELIGNSIFDHLRKEEIPKLKKGLESIQMQSNRLPAEIQLVHKDGHIVLVESKGVPIIEDNGQMDHIVLFSRDITEKNFFIVVPEEYAC